MLLLFFRWEIVIYAKTSWIYFTCDFSFHPWVIRGSFKLLLSVTFFDLCLLIRVMCLSCKFSLWRSFNWFLPIQLREKYWKFSCLKNQQKIRKNWNQFVIIRVQNNKKIKLHFRNLQFHWKFINKKLNNVFIWFVTLLSFVSWLELLEECQ